MTDEQDVLARANPDVDLWPLVPRLLGAGSYCVLATADAAGRPWATPVFFAAQGHDELFWVSAPDSRHSRNIAVRSTIGITVFDSTVPIGGAEALYLEAEAGTVDGTRQTQALEVLNLKLPARQALSPADLVPDGPLQAYRAVVDRHFVLVRGGDARFTNVVDRRLPVRPPG
jgi:hypothetical protein